MTTAKVIDVTGEVISPEHENITPLFSRHMAAYRFFAAYVKGKRTLEIGFGEGYGTDFLAGYASEITGIDVSAELVEHAREKYARGNLKFIRADATGIPFGDGVFDVVVSSQVLEHVKDYMKHLREARRVLKDGGLFIAATPNRKAMIDGVNPYHYKEFSASELMAALGKVFRDAEVMGLFGSPRYMELKKSEQGFAKKLLALDFLRLRRLLPRMVLRPLYRLAFEAVNRRTEGLSEEAEQITAGDFSVRAAGADKSLDLIGVCRK